MEADTVLDVGSLAEAMARLQAEELDALLDGLEHLAEAGEAIAGPNQWFAAGG